MSGLEKNVDEKTLARILEQCGRQCQSQSFVKKAKGLYEKSESIDDFLEKLGRAYKHLRREGGEVYIVYPRCLLSSEQDSEGKALWNILQLLPWMGESIVRRSARQTSRSHNGKINH